LGTSASSEKKTFEKNLLLQQSGGLFRVSSKEKKYGEGLEKKLPEGKKLVSP